MGGRGASSSSNKEIREYENLKKYHENKLKSLPKDATWTRDAENNAIKFLNDKINEIKKQSKERANKQFRRK